MEKDTLTKIFEIKKIKGIEYALVPMGTLQTLERIAVSWEKSRGRGRKRRCASGPAFSDGILVENPSTPQEKDTLLFKRGQFGRSVPIFVKDRREKEDRRG